MHGVGAEGRQEEIPCPARGGELSPNRAGDEPRHWGGCGLGGGLGPEGMAGFCPFWLFLHP